MNGEGMGQGLLAAFATAPDPRSPHGRRHPLPAILALATAAIRSGARSLYAMAQWGRLQPLAVVRGLGFTRVRAPAVTTLHLVFRDLDAEAFERALSAWARATLGDEEAIAIDGKGVRGIRGEALPGVRLVAGYADGAGLVLAQSGVSAREREGELTVAPAVLAALLPRGRLVTGDALYCQRTLCRQIRRKGGDSLVTVKANQPDLLWAPRTLFAEPPPGERFATAVCWDAHGDRVETRRLWASSAPRGYLDWPGARRMAMVERVCVRQGTRTREVRYAITSLGAEVGAAALLEHVRGHWSIENRLHRVRDVTMGEDASQVRDGEAPQVLAALRITVIAVVRNAGWTTIAEALRHSAWQPGSALAMLGLPPP